jgi:hypothetical protein
MTTTKKKWQRYYYGWKESGKTQQDYCKIEGIHFSTFKNILYKHKIPIPKSPKIKLEMRVHQNGVLKQGTFEEVKVIKSPDNTSAKTPPYCELKFNGTEYIQISTIETLIKLKALIRCLS